LTRLHDAFIGQVHHDLIHCSETRTDGAQSVVVLLTLGQLSLASPVGLLNRVPSLLG